MEYLARKAIEKAIRDLKLSLTPKAKETSQDLDNKQIIYLLEQTKITLDKAIKEIK